MSNNDKGHVQQVSSIWDYTRAMFEPGLNPAWTIKELYAYALSSNTFNLINIIYYNNEIIK